MSQITVHQAIEIALSHQHSGNLQAAEDIYRQILQTFPEQQDALHLLASTLCERGDLTQAESLARQAIALAPNEPNFQLTLGIILQKSNKLPDAIAACQNLLTNFPNLPEAHAQLGTALSLAARHDEAITAFREALKRAPDNPTTQGNLGIALCHLRQPDEALYLLRAALAKLPQNISYQSALATALYSSGQLEAAIAACHQAIALAPDRGDAYVTLAATLCELNQPQQALAPARRAVELLPTTPNAHAVLGETLRNLGQLDEAIAVYHTALQRIPPTVDLYNNLANTLKDQGLLDDAIANYRQALEVQPLAHWVFSNLLYIMQYHPTLDPVSIYQYHVEFNRLYALPLAAAVAPHTNDRSPTRRLRVGYISTEFRAHALGHYLTPLLANHDHTNFEIICYADVHNEDALTFQLRQYADQWKNIRNIKDDRLAKMIRDDGIDILIDLHQHMGGNRALVFAGKPAPVQIAFAGYPGTTGLTSIDYRLTDRYLEPPEEFPLPSSETPILLPDTFWCYTPRAASIPVNPLPALSNNHITFGCFNNFCKVNEPTLTLWAQVLNAVPNSRLLLLAPEGSPQTRVINFLNTKGISPDRLSFVPYQKNQAYFQLYHRVDIALDTFPYNGHTTSLDAFFMGVPVITLVGLPGQSPVARAGWSQLKNLQLTDLAAATREEFIQIAKKLALNLPKLTEMRNTLRTRITASPLMDAQRYTKNIEAAYRTAWERYCKKSPASPTQGNP